MHKYILGGGISGLIYAYYNRYYIVSDSIGGQMSSAFSLGPRYLHHTDNSLNFLKELNIDYSTEEVKVGFLSDEGWVEDPDNSFREKYFLKSRNLKKLNSVYDSTVMNSNKRKFKILSVDFNDLIEELINKVKSRIINGRVVRINCEKKFFDIENINDDRIDRLYYDELVSTIPLNIFCDISNECNYDLKSYSMTYVLVDKSFYDLKDYNFVYDIRMNVRSHRMTLDPSGIVLDLFGSISEKELKKLYKNYISSTIIPNAQIISRDDLKLNLKSVKFIGRYGTWNRSWKIDKVLDVAINDSKSQK